MSAGKIIVYGGRGALGSAVVKHFKANNWWVGTIDLAANDEADANVIVSKDANWSAQAEAVMSGLDGILGTDKVDAIINVAGGWAGGNAASKDFLKTSSLNDEIQLQRFRKRSRRLSDHGMFVAVIKVTLSKDQKYKLSTFLQHRYPNLNLSVTYDSLTFT
ncbi:dihydropteridine reductase-like [Penaeus japonicus]|uniref:dihydropteridine reductase-like n=1 Tax=Penaeus japonicus TaxID=27405 RepID=UPI001C715C60|nr:dihydropteridine reductase-like [Penaeus japonicus]